MGDRFQLMILNPDYALEFVMRRDSAKKSRAHGGFWNEEIVNYFKIKKVSKLLILKQYFFGIDF